MKKNYQNKKLEARRDKQKQKTNQNRDRGGNGSKANVSSQSNMLGK